MEFVWRPSFDSLGEDASILSHWHYNHYSPPTGFNFDTLNSRHYYFESDSSSSKYNAPQKSLDLHKWIVTMKKSYQDHNHLFQLMGEDFTFMKAEDSFHNTDNMIDYYNANEGA
jgi:hypothetical protein